MICSKSKLDPELDKIRSILLENGYPEHLINSTIKRKLQQLDLNPAHTVKKFPVNLSVPWIGNVSMKFEKQITSAVMRCFFSVEPRVVFTTRQLLPTTERDVLSSHHQNNVIYQILCHCDSRYVGRTSQRLEERIKQHIPKSIANPPIHESAIGQHHFDNAQCALHYNKDKLCPRWSSHSISSLCPGSDFHQSSESSSLQTKRIRLLLEDL